MARIISKLTFFVLPALGSSILTAATPSTIVTFRHLEPDSALARFNRALACYISDATFGAHNEQCLNADKVAISTEQLPALAIEQLSSAIDDNSQTISTNNLREWWGIWSYALRETQLQNRVVASNLDEFKKNTGFQAWPYEVVAPSQIKGKTRVIYRSPESFARGLSVAQTLDTVDHDLSARIIETEVAIDRADNSGNVDFYSYNEEGLLSTTSLFPVGHRQVPTFCLSCHHSASRGAFTRSE